jgi:hypothetical protein
MLDMYVFSHGIVIVSRRSNSITTRHTKQTRSTKLPVLKVHAHVLTILLPAVLSRHRHPTHTDTIVWIIASPYDMFSLHISSGFRNSVVRGLHPKSTFQLMFYTDEELIMAFHVLLEEIERRKRFGGVLLTAAMTMTAENIVELVFRDHGGWAFLQLGQQQQSFLQQMQQQHSFNLPQLDFFANQQVAAPPMLGQAPSQNIVVHEQAAPIVAQQQGSSHPDKNNFFLDKFNKENERNEKMKNRYEDELALKARAELEAEEKKAIETEKENARKLKEAEERLKRTRHENDRKEDTVLRTDEAVSRADELKRQVREMTERAEQERLDSERRIAERRQEAAAKRKQDRQRQLDASRNREDERNRTRSEHEASRMQRSFSDRTTESGYGERELRDSRDGNLRYNVEDKQAHDYRQRMLLGDERSQQFSPTPSKYGAPDSDNDGSDSEEEKRKDPYELIGLPDRGRTPVKDIEITQRVLNKIHQQAIDTAVLEAKKNHAEKRMVEIKWAADILMNETNRRAFDEAGAIHPHEQQAWRRKSK